jgi:AraC-like DNA-binding protein
LRAVSSGSRGTQPIEAVAQEEVGYGDSSFFTRLFRRNVGLTPAQYRKRFGGLREVLTSAIGAVAAAAGR